MGVWLGTPCTSWSRARRGPPGSGWCQIRSNQHIWGLPNLLPRDVARIKLGNSTLRASARVIRTAVNVGCPSILENPLTSMLFIAPPIAKLLRLPCASFAKTHFCQHGARWRKATGLAAWHASIPDNLQLTCSGHNGICSRTNKPHIVLSGADPVSKILWTSIASKYTDRFGARAAKALVGAMHAQHYTRMHYLVNG